MILFFFFKQKTAYEMRISDWSSDVCSSDLGLARPPGARDRRTRDRQGIDRRAPAPPVDALGPALCDHELRRDARDIDRKRVVRARGGDRKSTRLNSSH